MYLSWRFNFEAEGGGESLFAHKKSVFFFECAKSTSLFEVQFSSKFFRTIRI
jgi:hypothetical protein